LAHGDRQDLGMRHAHKVCPAHADSRAEVALRIHILWLTQNIQKQIWFL